MQSNYRARHGFECSPRFITPLRSGTWGLLGDAQAWRDDFGCSGLRKWRTIGFFAAFFMVMQGVFVVVGLTDASYVLTCYAAGIVTMLAGVLGIVGVHLGVRFFVWCNNVCSCISFFFWLMFACVISTMGKYCSEFNYHQHQHTCFKCPQHTVIESCPQLEYPSMCSSDIDITANASCACIAGALASKKSCYCNQDLWTVKYCAPRDHTIPFLVCLFVFFAIVPCIGLLAGQMLGCDVPEQFADGYSHVDADKGDYVGAYVPVRPVDPKGVRGAGAAGQGHHPMRPAYADNADNIEGGGGGGGGSAVARPQAVRVMVAKPSVEGEAEGEDKSAPQDGSPPGSVQGGGDGGPSRLSGERDSML